MSQQKPQVIPEFLREGNFSRCKAYQVAFSKSPEGKLQYRVDFVEYDKETNPPPGKFTYVVRVDFFLPIAVALEKVPGAPAVDPKEITRSVMDRVVARLEGPAQQLVNAIVSTKEDTAPLAAARNFSARLGDTSNPFEAQDGNAAGGM